jgi:hypothetical protein
MILGGTWTLDCQVIMAMPHGGTKTRRAYSKFMIVMLPIKLVMPAKDA